MPFKRSVQIIESEAGWGQKVDETLYFDSTEEAEKYVKDYNDKHNTAKRTPDWYMVAVLGSIVEVPEKPKIDIKALFNKEKDDHIKGIIKIQDRLKQNIEKTICQPDISQDLLSDIIWDVIELTEYSSMPWEILSASSVNLYHPNAIYAVLHAAYPRRIRCNNWVNIISLVRNVLTNRDVSTKELEGLDD